MTPDLLHPPPPRLLQWVPCPVCNMLFKDVQGRGGHLRHTRDPAHTAYRAQNGLAKPKRSRYPDPAPPALPKAAQAPPGPPHDDEISVLDFGEPQVFDVLLEDEPASPEAGTSGSPPPELSALPPASEGAAKAPVAQALPQAASPVYPPPASPVQAPALPALPNGGGASVEAGKAGGQGAASEAKATQAGAIASPPSASPAPALVAQASPPGASSASPAPASPGQAPASPASPPASPAKATRLALPEAPIGYGAPGEAGEAGRRGASKQAGQPKAGAPPRPQATLASFASHATPAQAPPSVALGDLSKALLHTPPRPGLSRPERIVCLVIVLGIAGLALCLAFRELKATKQRATESHLIDGSKIVPSARPKKTGDPYWDRILGYTGDEEP